MRDRGGVVERRKSVRVTPKGTVSLRTADYEVRGRIANVCGGGLEMITLVSAPARVLGRNADLEVRFDTKQGGWLRLSGRILRIGATSLAIGFDTVPKDFDALLDETLTASHNRDRLLSIVLVDATVERRLRLAEAFRAVGCAVVDASTPLEGIVRLGEFHFEPDLVAIADSTPATISAELRVFVEAEHPNAKLVTISDDVNEPEGLAHWLSALDPAGDLASRILQVLAQPQRGTPRPSL